MPNDAALNRCCVAQGAFALVAREHAPDGAFEVATLIFMNMVPAALICRLPAVSARLQGPFGGACRLGPPRVFLLLLALGGRFFRDDRAEGCRRQRWKPLVLVRVVRELLDGLVGVVKLGAVHVLLLAPAHGRSAAVHVRATCVPANGVRGRPGVRV